MLKSQNVLRQPRGPPLEEGCQSWRSASENGMADMRMEKNTNGTSQMNGFSSQEIDHTRKTSVSSAYGADSPNHETRSFELGQDLSDMAEEQVYMSFISSPNEIWVQGADDARVAEIRKINDMIQVFCSNKPLLQKTPIINKIYGGVYSGDGQWYRCKIIQIPNTDEVKVLFIDFGNTEILKQNELVHLSSEMYHFTAFAKQYKLKGVADIKDCHSEQFLKGSELLSNLVMDKVVTVKNKSPQIGNTAVLVDLIYEENSKEININEEMRKNGFGSPPQKVPDVLNMLETPKRAVIVEELSTSKKPLTVAEGDQKKIFKLPEVNKGDQKMILKLQEMNKNQSKTIDTLKQLCCQLEKKKSIELEEATNKLNQQLDNIMSKKVNQLLSWTSQVRTIRKEYNVGGNRALKLVLDTKQLLEGQSQIDLDEMQELLKVKEAESMHSVLQNKIRICTDKSCLSGLVEDRNKARQDLYDCISAFLNHVNSTGLDLAKVKLEVAQSSLLVHSNNNTDVPTVENTLGAVIEYQEYMVKKEGSLREVRDLVDQKCKSLSDVFNHVGKVLNGEEQMEDIASFDDLDDVVVVLEALVQEETAKSKCSETEVNLQHKAVSSLLDAVTKQLNAINELRDVLLEYYTSLQNKIWECKDTKPDMASAIKNKLKIRELNPKLRHKLVDKEELKERDDSEADSQKMEEELNTLYKEVKLAFVEENTIIAHLANLTKEQFPELSLQYPEQGIHQWLNTNGLLKNTRELYHYPLEETPDLDVFISRLGDDVCYIKEYFFRDIAAKRAFQSRAVQFHNCNTNQLVQLDALFYSKNGRTGYLQVPFYESLQEWLQTTPSSEVIMVVVKDVLEALTTLHSHGIVHGAVTISNIFVSKQDETVRGLLGHYDFSENLEQRLSSTSSKMQGLPEDYPKCTKFDVMCLVQVLKSVYEMNLLNEDADLQSLGLLESLMPAHTT